MVENDNNQPEILTVFLCFVLALLGGTAKELSKAEEKFSWIRFTKNVIVSGFCGILIGLLSPDFEHKNWVMFCSGLAGFGGVKALDFLYDIFKAAVEKVAIKK